MELERRYSLKEAQDILGVSERTIHRWIKSGKLKSYKPGRDHQIPESAIREVIEESEVYPKDLEPPLPFNLAGSRGLEDLEPEELGDLIYGAMAQQLTNLEQKYGDTGFRTSSDYWIDLLNDFSDLVETVASDGRISPEAAQLVGCLAFSTVLVYSREEKSIRAFCRPHRIGDLDAAEARWEGKRELIDGILSRKNAEQAAEQESEFVARLKDRRERADEARKAASG